jgi:hypothetical protein
MTQSDAAHHLAMIEDAAQSCKAARTKLTKCDPMRGERITDAIRMMDEDLARLRKLRTDAKGQIT